MLLLLCATGYAFVHISVNAEVVRFGRAALDGGESAMTRVVTTEIIGWVSSLILLATLVKQVHKQWREGTSEGVSKWLFAGQTAASVGFTVYSFLVKNWVFVVTNALLLVNALVGWVILFRNKKEEEG